MTQKLTSTLSWSTALLTPIFLLGLGLRILLTPLYYNIEYRLPYFPPDTYGFTLEDRLRWAPYAVDYLLNDEDISYLTDLTFEDGTPLFNQRELSHMQDVKIVTRSALIVWYLVMGSLIGLGVWARFKHWWQAYLQGLKRGSWLIIILIALAGVFGALAFRQFFTLFHALFFEGDSWIFLYSDTLIRLFPIRFWQDAFLSAALIAVGTALGLIVGLRKVT